MTLDEAKKIGEIIQQADGGCSYCIDELRKLCQKAFPQFSWTVNGEYGTTVCVEPLAGSDDGG